MNAMLLAQLHTADFSMSSTIPRRSSVPATQNGATPHLPEHLREFRGANSE